MNEHSMRFRLGVFVLTSLIVLAILVTLFGGNLHVFKTQDTYTIVFDQATGVAPGTPVRRSGVRIGQVEKVELDDVTGKVRVTIAIDRPHVLYEDDQPVLVHGALSGDTTIDFVQKQPSSDEPRTQSSGRGVKGTTVSLVNGQPPIGDNQPLPAPQPQPRVPAKPGAQFQGQTQADVAAMLGQISELTPPARDAFLELRKTLDRYEAMTPLMEETLREYRDLARATRDTIPELRRTNAEAQVTAQNWGRLGERLDLLLRTNEDKMIQALDNFNRATARVANTFNEENQRNLATSLRNASDASKNFPSISKNTDELVKQSLSTVQRVNDSVTRANEVITNLQRTTQPMAERSPRIMQNIDESADKLNRSLTNVNDMLGTTAQSDSTFRRFLTDPSLYNNLNEAACMLVRIMPRIDHMLRDFEVFADKIARHPESLGVGGAVRPSSGLKDSPFSTPSYRQQ
jgi:ABC-type transporter Mla subunit MlaD